MNCNNSVTIENETDGNAENYVKSTDQMAKPHSQPLEEQPSCSNQIEDVSFHLLRMLEDSRVCEERKQSIRYKVTDQLNHEMEVHKDGRDVCRDKQITGRRVYQMSDDGISTISSEGQAKRKSRPQIQELQAASPKHRSPRQHSPTSIHSVKRDKIPHSATVSYSSSKSSTPMKKDTSYTSQHTRSSCKSEGAVCRICHEGDQTEVLISPCYCAGSMGLLHVSCLQRWLGSSNKTSCEICNFEFTMTKTSRPFKEFLKDPGTARDRRNLICDIASFLLITPLTIATTWLSIAGANKYYKNRAWERGGLIGLSVTLWLLYLIWFLAAARHNYRLWRDWVMFHQDVTLTCSPDVTQGKTRDNRILDKEGSISTVSSVHLEGIQIKVSGQVGRHRKKDKKQSNVPVQDVKQLPGTSIHDGQHLSRDVKTKQHHDQPHHSNPMIHNYTGRKTNKRNIDKGPVKYFSDLGHCICEEAGSSQTYEQGCMEKQHENRKTGKFISPRKECRDSNSLTNKSQNLYNTETVNVVDDRYGGPSAIFSRGNSPEDDGNTKTASQQYTEDWLDLKSVAGDRKRDSSDESYHTCVEPHSHSYNKQDLL